MGNNNEQWQVYSSKQLSNCPMKGNDICYNSHSSIITFQNRNKVIAIEPNQLLANWPSDCFICDDLNVPMSGLLVKECMFCYNAVQLL